jgi:hypothetical protein
VFTTAEVIRRVRRANASSAGGLSGTDYLTLRAWFDQADSTSDKLTGVLNLVAAGKVPDSVSKLFTAGRGVAIPKNDNGDLRPIVVGYVVLRLIGSIAICKLAPDIAKYFFAPKHFSLEWG